MKMRERPHGNERKRSEEAREEEIAKTKKEERDENPHGVKTEKWAEEKSKKAKGKKGNTRKKGVNGEMKRKQGHFWKSEKVKI
jgi:hypothetical protein